MILQITTLTKEKLFLGKTIRSLRANGKHKKVDFKYTIGL